ncbi:MAG: DNA polymerase Y family protein [Hyphomicrobiaceae bacterium]
MPRIVSVWLPAWPIARLLLGRGFSAAQPEAVDQAVDPWQPLVLVAPGKGGARITALNRAAGAAGLQAGDLLSNARSKVMHLQVREADPAADAAALRRLALWALRYTPTVAPWNDETWGETGGADGLFLDIAGCAHLMGGEEALLRDLAGRLSGFGLRPRLALAGTAGTSWALARYGPASCAIVPDGGEAAALRDLPVAALRFSVGALSLMRRLGFRRIGAVMDQPRAPFAARFAGELLLRLDQALGRAPEPLDPVVPPPVYRAQASFLEPIASAEHVLVAATRLLHDLALRLAQDDVGARLLRLLLFRVDGDVTAHDVALAAPSRDPAHIARLIALRLERLHDGGGLDAGFGFEAAAIHVRTAEPLAPRQASLAMREAEAPADGLAQLIDRLRQRLGADAVRRIHPCQSHLPERAEALRAAEPGAVHANALTSGAVACGPVAPRPILLLPTPEPAEVVALIPDGPPRQFRWRGVMHQVAEAEGPERIAPEWWRRTAEAERDYYTIEDTAGRRFWLFRHGLYGTAHPQWFVHGVFG